MRVVPVPAVLIAITAVHHRIPGRSAFFRESSDKLPALLRVVVVHVAYIDPHLSGQFRAERLPVAAQVVREVVVLPPERGDAFGSILPVSLSQIGSR